MRQSTHATRRCCIRSADVSEPSIWAWSCSGGGGLGEGVSSEGGRRTKGGVGELRPNDRAHLLSHPPRSLSVRTADNSAWGFASEFMIFVSPPSPATARRRKSFTSLPFSRISADDPVQTVTVTPRPSCLSLVPDPQLRAALFAKEEGYAILLDSDREWTYVNMAEVCPRLDLDRAHKDNPDDATDFWRW